MNIPLSNPDITQLEIDRVTAVLQTPHLSLGPLLPEFENEFACYTGSRHAIAVNSGTSALHLVVRALGITTGDFVITTPFSFIASSNCILFEGATPIFVDIDEKTYNIDVQKMEATIAQAIQKGIKVKAILPVHVFGVPSDMHQIKNIALKYDLKIIEDACEALGARIDTKMVGNFGDAGVFAFYPNKQMTTGEGGMIVTDNDRIATLCRSMRNQGRGEKNVWLTHERLGYNYRLSDINCALGLAQLQRITDMLKKRQMVAETYNRKLADIDGVHTPYYKNDGRQSWFVYVIRLSDDFSEQDRDAVLTYLHDKRIGSNKYFPPIHLQPFYKEQFGFRPGDFPVTEKIASRTIALPFFNNLTEKQIDYVVGHLADAIKTIKGP